MLDYDKLKNSKIVLVIGMIYHLLVVLTIGYFLLSIILNFNSLIKIYAIPILIIFGMLFGEHFMLLKNLYYRVF